MGLVKNISEALKVLRFGKKEYTQTQIADIMSSFDGSSTYLTETGAFAEIATVYACIKARTKAISSLPMYIYKNKENPELVTNPKLTKLIDDPNPHFTFRWLMMLVEMWKLISGVAYIYYDGEDFWIKEASLMQPKETNIFPPQNYIYAGGPTIPKEDLIIFRDIGPTSMNQGVSPLKVALTTSKIDKNLQNHILKFFENAAVLGAVMSSKESLNEIELEKIINLWNKQHQGSDKAHKTAFITGDWTYQKIVAGLNELEVASLKDILREDICIAFGVPPAVIGIPKYAQYSNSKEQKEMFWTQEIIPESKDFEDTITLWLRNNYGQRDIFAEYDLMASSVIAQMEEERHKTYKEYGDGGYWSRNEVRAEMGRIQVPGADDLLVSAMLVPIGTVPNKKTINSANLKTKSAFSSRRPLSKEARIKLWKRFDVLLRSKDNKFKSTMQKQFREQEKRVIKRWHEFTEDKLGLLLFDGSISNDIKRWHEFTKGNIYKALDDFDPFTIEDEIVYFGRATRALFMSFIQDAGNLSFVDIGIDRDFILTPKVLSWIAKTIKDDFKLVHISTRDEIIEAIREGIGEGESIWQIEERLKGVFDKAHDYRSERIARTEVLGANNFGTIEGYEQSEVVEGKEWLATQDKRARDWHADPFPKGADGQVVGLNEQFVLNIPGGGEEYADYPGDPNLSAANRINCRCTTLAVLKKEE